MCPPKCSGPAPRLASAVEGRTGGSEGAYGHRPPNPEAKHFADDRGPAVPRAEELPAGVTRWQPLAEDSRGPLGRGPSRGRPGGAGWTRTRWRWGRTRSSVFGGNLGQAPPTTFLLPTAPGQPGRTALTERLPPRGRPARKTPGCPCRPAGRDDRSLPEPMDQGTESICPLWSALLGLVAADTEGKAGREPAGRRGAGAASPPARWDARAADHHSWRGLRGS